MESVGQSSQHFYLVQRFGPAVIVRRTKRRHQHMSEVGTAFASIYDQLEGVDLSSTPLVVDLRLVVGRNDDSFEAEVAPHRRELIASFARTAILVRTTIGALQVKRMFAAEGIDVEVFTSEPECLDWLHSPQP
ncbi:MAG: hypothetical protein ACE37F_16255 [Nannocystaceae bacterium]|nr:hypothetical protein [bacterium]